MPGLAPTHVQDLALGLVAPHEVHVGPLLLLVQVPLDGLPSRRRASRTAQLGVVKLVTYIQSFTTAKLLTVTLSVLLSCR